MATEKAVMLRRELKDELSTRLPSLTITENFDANGNATLQVGAGTAGSKGGFVQIVTIPSVFKNSIGLTQDVWTPHIIRLAVEANPAGGAGADVNDWATTLAILGAILGKGTKVEVWTSANGTAPDVTVFNTASNLQATYENLQYGLMINQ